MAGSRYWDGRQTRFNRRGFLAGSSALAAGAAAAGLAGCGDDDDNTTGAKSPAAGGSSPAAAQPKPGGTLRTTGGATGVQDPNIASVPTYVAAWMGDPFMQLSNKTREVSPGVIEKWEQVDKNTLVMKVRPGVKFFNMKPANGRTLEAKDIVYTIKSMTGAQYPDAKVPFPRKGLFTNVKDPVAVDPSTVRLETTTPRSDLVLSLAEYRNAVLPEGLREAFGGIDSLFEPKAERLVGTGPFIAKTVDSQGETVWERNPEYWNKPYPYIDKVQYNYVGDPAAGVSSFIAGTNHFRTFSTPQEIDTLKRGLPNVQLISFPLNGFYNIAFNTRKKELADPRVRLALAMMFDKPAFSDAVLGKGNGRLSGPLPWGYNESLSQEELGKTVGMRSPTAQDIADAKKMIDAAGFGNFSVSHISAADILGVSAFKLVSEHWKEQVEKNLPSVKINIEISTYTNMLAVIPKPEAWESYTSGPSQELTPIQMLQLVYATKGARNFTGYGSPAFDKLIDDALGEFDEKKRTALLQDAQRIMLKDVPLFTNQQGLITSAFRPELQGLDPLVGGVGFVEHWLRYASLKT